MNYTPSDSPKCVLSFTITARGFCPCVSDLRFDSGTPLRRRDAGGTVVAVRSQLASEVVVEVLILCTDALLSSAS